MKNAIKKIAASTICGALLLSMAGCADTSWSVKDDDEMLSVGTYIYYMTEAYGEAKQKTGKSGNDVLSETIDKKTGDEWIRDRAKELCAEQLTLDKLCQDNKITVTDEEVDATYTDKSAFYGMYSYSDMWVMSKQSYEAMGISEKSYKNAIIKTALEKDRLFNKLYGEGGTQEVKEDELKKYFTENYVSYKYLTTSLNSTDSEGNTTTMSDEEKEVVKARYERYANIINEQKKTLDDVAAQYNKDYPSESSSESSNNETTSSEASAESSKETTSSEASAESSKETTSSEASAESSKETTSSEASAESSKETTSSEASSNESSSSENSNKTTTNPIQSSVEDLSSDNFVFGNDVKNKLKEMKEGEAAYVGTSSAYYFLYKMPIADEVSTALAKDGANSERSAILHSLKDDDFDKYIDEQTKKIDYEFNDAAFSKYTPSRVIPDSDNSKEESSESSTESKDSSESSTESKASSESSTESKASSESSTESKTSSESSTESKTSSGESSKAESSAQG